MKQYDIFISYRRSSYDTANLIATRLKAAGYSVFFDMETLRSGKFNEQLYNVIDNCKDFIVVLPPNALDRCVNEDDWVRLEVCRAMEKNKCIIPIMLNGFTWPNPMPERMEELCNYQALTANSIEYFDLAMERLQKKYLQSKKHLPLIKFIKYGLTLISILLVICAIAWGVLWGLSKSVCLEYATAIANDASYVHMIAEENYKLEKEWISFNNAIEHEYDTDNIAQLQQKMESRIDFSIKNLSNLWLADSVKLDISKYEKFLLSIHGINAEEIAVSPQMATLYYISFLDQLELIRNAVKEPFTLNRRYSSVLFEVYKHNLNGYYASILSELSNFPEKSRVTYNELSPHWIYFPTQMYKIGEERSYYENIINTESQLASEIMDRFESVIEQQDAELEDLDRKNKELEHQMEEKLSQIQNNVDSATKMYQDIANLDNIQKQNDSELALREEKVKAKEFALQATKSELEEIDKQYVKVYEELKKKCTLEPEDDQWHKWGKITLWGNYLSMLVDSRQNLKANGIYSTSSITPEIAYADMRSMLTVYEKYHPESKEYVASAKQFFKELSKGERPYVGVVIFAFKENVSHPFFKEGDIIVKYDNKPVKDYNAFKSAYKANDKAIVVFHRLINGEFEEFKQEIIDTDIIGFLNLTDDK